MTQKDANSPSVSSTLFNQSENIKVAVRLRPFTEKERQRGSQSIVDIEKNTVALFSSRHRDAGIKKFTFDYSYWSHDGFKRDSNGINVPDKTHPNCAKYVGQEKVFEDLGHFLLTNALEGYNSALLAYGQTGSGKSYTVSGYGQNEGILPRFARSLFEELDKKSKSAKIQEDEVSKVVRNNSYEVYFSMIEIYNEVVRDLLSNSHGFLTGQSSVARRGLKVREHPKKGFFVEHLASYACSNKEEIECLIEEGHLNKSIAATSMNETSSRGHTIYEFKIKQFNDKTKDQIDETLITSIVQLVDLAGSERMAIHANNSNGSENLANLIPQSPRPELTKVINGKTINVRAANSASSSSSTSYQPSKSMKRSRHEKYSLYNSQQQRFKESVSINQSLSALGNCIQVLSQYSQQLDSNNPSVKRQRPKIPYRDSVLTKLLNACCLGGNSRVVIIATLSPAESSYDDTLSTLRFADRAKQIKTHAIINRITTDQTVGALQKENERLKQIIDNKLTKSDDSSQTSNFDDNENMSENFIGPRKNGSYKFVDSIVTPTRSKTVKKQKDNRSSRTNDSSRIISSTSNPSLNSSLKARMSDRSHKRSAISSEKTESLSKSRSVGHSLNISKSQNHETLPRNVAIDPDELDMNELIKSGMIDDREADNLEDNFMSSDSDESFNPLSLEGLGDREKIELFNRLLSSSKIVSKMEKIDNKSKTKHKIPRPVKIARSQTGVESVAALSSNLKKSNPYLCNLNSDEQLTGMISYIIKKGDTIIGKSNDCDVVLHGPELRPQHAKISRVSRKLSMQADDTSDSGVYIEPMGTMSAKIGETSDGFNSGNQFSLMLNGSPITKRTKLNHCDRLLFGSNIYFVFIDNEYDHNANGDTIANLDLITFDMARNEVLRKVMNQAQNEPIINEINRYTHRPGTGKFKSAVEKKVSTNQDTNNIGIINKDHVLSRSTSQQEPDQENLKSNEVTIEKGKADDNYNSSLAADKDKEETIEDDFRSRLMDDTYEYAMPVAEVNAIAKEMGIKVTYGLKILTGEEQLREQIDINYSDSNISDGSLSTQDNQTPIYTESHDDRITVLGSLNGLDIAPALYIHAHLEALDIDFYWSKDKFQARRFKILELYAAWEVSGKSGLVEQLIDQSRIQGDYLFDPFIDDMSNTLVLIGHSQITLQPISYLSDMEQHFDVININDEVVGSINIRAIPCNPSRNSNRENNQPFEVYSDDELAEKMIQDPRKLLNEKLVFSFEIISCNGIPCRYTNVFCQYSLNKDKPIIRTTTLREDSLDIDNSDDKSNGLSFNHRHFICFDQVTEDILSFLDQGFVTVQIVGQYWLGDRINKAPTIVSTIINSINKYKDKLDQRSSLNSANYSSSVYDNSNTDSAGSNRGASSEKMHRNSGPSSVGSTSATVNLFDQQNDDDEGLSSMNGLSQENIIDMILTKRKLDRAENQLHYLKRTINIAEHYNKKHIPVKTVKKLLNSYSNELENSSFDELTEVNTKTKISSNKNSNCNIQ